MSNRVLDGPVFKLGRGACVDLTFRFEAVEEDSLPTGTHEGQGD